MAAVKGWATERGRHGARRAALHPAAADLSHRRHQQSATSAHTVRRSRSINTKRPTRHLLHQAALTQDHLYVKAERAAHRAFSKALAFTPMRVDIHSAHVLSEFRLVGGRSR